MGAYVTINPTPSGDITGSGTAGYLAMFTSANVIGDSTINQASGNTGVGMAASANAGFAITTTAATSGTKNAFYFLQTGNTNQAASTEASGALWNMGTRQWATGAITSQREFYIQSCAYSFVGASVITDAYGLYVEAPTASTNATITNAYAAGFSGYVNVIADSSTIKIRSLVGTASSAAIYLNQATPSATNYTITSDGSNVYLNTQSTTGFCYITTANNTRFYFGRSGMASSFAADVSGATTSFSFITPPHTGQTASTEIPNFKVTGNTKTWAAGNITTQRWNYFTANTAAFASASTITNSYGLYVEAATAGTNATITNNWAAGFSGSLELINGRLVRNQGADVASANNLVLGTDGNVFEITGTTQINLISNIRWKNGAMITLLFTSTPTVKHNQATSTTNITIQLAGAADFVATAGDTLTLVLSEIGGTQAWREVSRAVI